MGSVGHLWQATIMNFDSESQITSRVIDALYIEAMVLADEARAYFDEACHDSRVRMTPLARVTFSCESLKVTTRLMHVIAWLLNQKAMMRGDAVPSGHGQLGTAAMSESNQLTGLPEEAQRVVTASDDLYQRIKRIDKTIYVSRFLPNPARQLQSRLMSSL